MIDLCVVGLGYIGLPTATIFADAGLQVHGVDSSDQVVDGVNAGTAHIIEPSLSEVLARVVGSGSLTAGTTPVPAAAFIIAVPTPLQDDRQPDLSYVIDACDAIAPSLSAGCLVILESTSPVGTTEQIAARLAQLRPDLGFPVRGGTHEADETVAVAYCPERVLPGKILHELRHNDRILGGISPQSAERAAALYRTVVVGQCNTTDARTAELAKLSENAFRDVNIALANELSMVSAELEIDPQELIRLANRHPRVNILTPGPGVGGHCIAIDPWFIVNSSPDSAKLIRAAREVNLEKTAWVVRQITSAADQAGSKSIALLGLAYKPDIGDLRESPALDVARQLNALGYELFIVEPSVDALPAGLDGSTHTDLADALTRVQTVVVLVKHSTFVTQVEQVSSFAGHVVDTVGLLSDQSP